MGFAFCSFVHPFDCLSFLQTSNLKNKRVWKKNKIGANVYWGKGNSCTNFQLPRSKAA